MSNGTFSIYSSLALAMLLGGCASAPSVPDGETERTREWALLEQAMVQMGAGRYGQAWESLSELDGPAGSSPRVVLLQAHVLRQLGGVDNLRRACGLVRPVAGGNHAGLRTEWPTVLIDLAEELTAVARDSEPTAAQAHFVEAETALRDALREALREALQWSSGRSTVVRA